LDVDKQSRATAGSVSKFDNAHSIGRPLGGKVSV